MVDTRTLHGLDGTLAALKSLPAEIVSKRGGPVKSALRKGSKVVQQEWQARVQDIINTENRDGEPSKTTGLLKKSIINTRHPRPHEIGANEAYTVRIKGRRFYPATRGKRVTASRVGRYLEIGTERRPPIPWAVPGYFASREKALTVTVDELNKGIARVIAKLSKGRS